MDRCRYNYRLLVPGLDQPEDQADGGVEALVHSALKAVQAQVKLLPVVLRLGGTEKLSRHGSLGCPPPHPPGNPPPPSNLIDES